jgi:hypothetical protein
MTPLKNWRDWLPSEIGVNRMVVEVIFRAADRSEIMNEVRDAD